MSGIPPERQQDNNGLIWAYRLDGHGQGTEVTRGGERSEATDRGFTWWHLRSDDLSAVAHMQELGLDASVIDALTANETRPRTMTLGDGLVVVLRGVNTNPGADPEEMVSVRLWFTGDTVVSARKKDRRLLSIVDIRQSIEDGHGPKSSSEFVATLVEKLADRIGDVVDEIDEELTTAETNSERARTTEVRSKVAESRRQAAAIRRYLAPQREALDTLYRNRGALTEEDAFSLCEQTDRVMRYVEDLDLARERALVLQDELRNQIAEEQNSRIYVLSIVAAIFLPLSFLTGVFGMNVAGLPGTENPRAFMALAISMGAVGVALIVFMRSKNWL